MRAVSPRLSLIRLPGLALLLGLLAACAVARAPLNSEMIADRFGSYGVEVISQSADRRVTDLYSGSESERTTRTLAVVRFTRPVDNALNELHQQILAGGSLGATLKSAGWRVEKRSLGFRAVAAGPGLATMMRLAPQTPLAVHLYTLSAARDDLRIPYAQIAEVHHPDHLAASDLRRIFGDNRPTGGSSTPQAGELWATLVETLKRL